MRLQDAGRIHFVGIGGAGMSAIAKVLIERGAIISGSDLKPSRAMTTLEAMGAGVQLGHDAAIVEEAGVVIVSSAIPASNPEFVRARELGLPVMTRGEALADVLADRRSVVVAGTHGKTTTTSMIVSALVAIGRDPTYLVGGGLNESGTNARAGSDDVAVAEADESDGSFLRLHPDIAVITNVEEDHVDYWGSLDEILSAFSAFMSSVPDGGAIVVPAADESLVARARDSGRRVITTGPEGDIASEEVRLGPGGSAFVLVAAGERTPAELRVPGEHNISNALAASGALLELGVSAEQIAAGLNAYRGVERRFQIRGEAAGVTVVDDYAHHPTEVRATLSAARPGPWRRVVAVFQPHRYSRTAAFAQAFGESFDAADQIVITDVYGAGEEPVPGVSGKLIADAICDHLPGRPVAYLPHRADLIAYLEKSSRPGDVVLTLGAGDITAIGEQLLTRWGS